MEFALAVKLRLGIRIFQENTDCSLCLVPMDRMGDHGLHCSRGGGWQGRHNGIRDAFAAMAAAASLGPQVERGGIVEGRFRPADVLLPSWPSGQTTCYDVTVVSPTQDRYLVRAAQEAGVALEGASRDKRDKHQQRCEDQGLLFAPIAVETFGGWGKEAVDAIKGVSRALARNQARSDSEVIGHSFQKLSVVLMRGNASILATRLTVASGAMVGDL